MKRVVVFLLLGALIVGVVGCTPANSFGTPMYPISISSTTGGTVTDPGEGLFRYAAGTVVTLVAEPDRGYHFVSWVTNAGTIADVSATTTTITVNNYYFITASFHKN